MRANGVEAAIARYREAGTKKRYAQSELRANGECVLGGFTVLCIFIPHIKYYLLRFPTILKLIPKIVFDLEEILMETVILLIF